MLVLIGVKVELLVELEVLVVCFNLCLFDVNVLLKMLCEEVDVYVCEYGGCCVEVDSEVVKKILKNL